MFIVTILFLLYCWFQVKNYHKYIEYWVYSFIYMYLNEIYFCSNYDLIYMILDNLTIFWLWYIEFLFLLYYWFQVKDYYKYILIPSIWFLHIYLNKIYSFWKLWFHVYDYEQFDYELILIPSQWGLFIGTLIPSQWGLFIGTLMPSHRDIAWP